MSAKKVHSPRLVISIALFVAALLASFLMSVAANQKERYWVAINPVAAGSEVRSQDLAQIEVTLGESRSKYLPASFNPVGSISLRRLLPGELIFIDSLTESGVLEINEEISLSLRSVDIPTAVAPGSLVSIFQLHDAKNGEAAMEPLQILHSVHVTSIDRKGSNFGGEVALTISANPREVLRLLAASTSGRLVAVHSYE
ncbi:SAF_CpaB_FlgA_like domain containing protein [Candidatus Nanopelagicaceae bacterium]